MKNRILTFVIGVLVGAIIMTSVFLIINNTKGNDFGAPINGGMPQGQMMPGSNTDSNNNSQNTNTPPEKPEDANTQNSNTNN